MNDLYTFSRLMDDYGIAIPMIQRGYAQGRESAHAVRQSFLSSIIETISSGSPLSLDFVYGPIVGGTFLPLDGQQRLTTLFLVHWYFDAIGDKWKEFKYQSRRMAQRFIDFLRSDDCRAYLARKDDRGLPSKWLRKQSKFVPAWECDPTVSGMIVLLDHLHLIACGLKCENAAERLDSITFYLHICDATIRADDTYLKINARGEHLSEWENIKSILDSRVKDLVKRNDDIGRAARDWRDNINGSWMSAIEGFLPTRGESRLVHYIALSIELVNAAFRNIIDLAAMISLTQIDKKVENRRAQLGSQFSTMGFAEAVVGVRDRASDIKDSLQLEKFFVREFHDHTAIYEDYRDKYVFTDEAFVVVATLFSALVDSRKNVVVGGWPDDRYVNVLWNAAMSTSDIDQCTDGGKWKSTDRSFVKEFLFSGANPEGDSLLESERDPFRKWIEQDRIAKSFHRTSFTYESGLRYFLLASPGDSPAVRFGKTRVLNLIDNTTTIDADNFREFASAITGFLECFSGAIDKHAISALLEKHFAGMKKLLPPILDAEKRKIELYAIRGDDVLANYTYGKIERQLGLMSGCVEFTYDENKRTYDEERANFFLSRFLTHDAVVNDTGFLDLLKWLPENVNGLPIPQSSTKDKDGFESWKKTLMNPVWAEAFVKLFQASTTGSADASGPQWLKSYVELIKKEGWPYRKLCRYGAGHNGGERLFAYNTSQRMSKYCACVEYFGFERKLIELLRPNDGYCIRFGDIAIRIKDCPTYAIPLEDFYSNKGILNIRKIDGDDKFVDQPQMALEYKSQEELFNAISDFIIEHKKLES